jgi:predicted TIM-barrel fold metal-dependent hydrolase
MLRRDFLMAALAVTSAGTMTEAAEPGPLYNGEIVDTHQHLWNLKELRLPWVNGLTDKAKDILGRDHLLADYAEAAKGLNVAKSVYMEVDVAEADQLKEVEFVTKVCMEGKTPMVAAVISGRPASAGFKDYLDRLKGNKHIKGLRQVLHTPATPPKFCLDDAFVKGVQLLGERGLSFDLCLKNDQLEYGAELVDRCPQTRFILDHCGNPHNGGNDLEAWKKGLARVAGAKNRQVMCKVSGLYGNVSATDWPTAKVAPLVRAVLDLFGWDRVLFASDWPVVNLGASFRLWVETVKEIVRADSAENQRKLFRDNAIKFYGLG